MKLCTVVALILFANLLTASAKISGGPRGRFDPPRPTPTQSHVSAHSFMFWYQPPSHIDYLCRFCRDYNEYPVYPKPPPTYVYKFRECHSRFAILLTGLALYNLGRSTVQHSYYYTPQSDEECSMHVVIDEEFHETRFPCLIMSTFLDPEKNIDRSHADINTFDITATQHVDFQPYLREFIYDYPFRTESGQECVLWYNTTYEKVNETMPCGLLQKYGQTMVRSDIPAFPAYMWWTPPLAIFAINAAICAKTCRLKPLKDYEYENYIV